MGDEPRHLAVSRCRYRKVGKGSALSFQRLTKFTLPSYLAFAVSSYAGANPKQDGAARPTKAPRSRVVMWVEVRER